MSLRRSSSCRGDRRAASGSGSPLRLNGPTACAARALAPTHGAPTGCTDGTRARAPAVPQALGVAATAGADEADGVRARDRGVR